MPDFEIKLNGKGYGDDFDPFCMLLNDTTPSAVCLKFQCTIHLQGLRKTTMVRTWAPQQNSDMVPLKYQLTRYVGRHVIAAWKTVKNGHQGHRCNDIIKLSRDVAKCCYPTCEIVLNLNSQI